MLSGISLADKAELEKEYAKEKVKSKKHKKVGLHARCRKLRCWRGQMCSNAPRRRWCCSQDKKKKKKKPQKEKHKKSKGVMNAQAMRSLSTGSIEHGFHPSRCQHGRHPSVHPCLLSIQLLHNPCTHQQPFNCITCTMRLAGGAASSSDGGESDGGGSSGGTPPAARRGGRSSSEDEDGFKGPSRLQREDWMTVPMERSRLKEGTEQEEKQHEKVRALPCLPSGCCWARYVALLEPPLLP